MQQDNNNMDKKLKQLENQSLPDLSKMDQHWDDLKRSLQPEASLPKSKANNKIFRCIAVASMVGIVLFASYKLFLANNEKIISTNNWERKSATSPKTDTLPSIKFLPGKENSTIISKDTITLRTQNEQKAKTTGGKEVELKWMTADDPDKKSRDTLKFEPSKEKTNYPPVPVILKGQTTEGKKIEVIAIPMNDTTNKKQDADKKKALQDFFADLEKESQSFVINNERDTMIKGNEGTELYINANSFYPNKNVTIRLQEFYSYQDIITNKLTTTSGEKLLISGGMLNIMAFSGNKELVSAQKEILIKMPTDKLDDSMQLFLDQTNYSQLSSSIIENPGYDTVGFANPINWVPAGQSQNIQRTLPLIQVLNLLDDHHSVAYDRYTTASYLIANNCPLSNQQVKVELEKRYGRYYGRIKVRRIWGNRKRVFLSSNTEWPIVGDSLFVPFETALKYKLISRKDSLKYVRDLKSEDSLYYARVSKMEKKYNFRITNLGWINCDRFYNDYRPKIEFIVNLGDTASNYYTLLVFEKMKSLMNGYVSGNKVIFSNVPEGESAKIISVSIKDGKPVAAMQPVQLSRKTFEGLKFEEITTSEFKQKAGEMDK